MKLMCLLSLVEIAPGFPDFWDIFACHPIPTLLLEVLRVYYSTVFFSGLEVVYVPSLVEFAPGISEFWTFLLDIPSHPHFWES